MSEIRAISAIPLPADIAPGEIGPRPTIVRMNPADLSVDAKYQRELSRKSITLIHKLVSGWDWRRFKPPVVARVGESWHVIDGQHTAIAAVTHGSIGEIDVMVVDAEEGIDRAKAFIGHNRDRVAITNTQIFFAAAAAGDEDALTAMQVCERAGATILRNPTPGRPFRPGEIIAVSALVRLIKRRSAMKARIVVETLVKARAAPISADLIQAVDLVLHDEQYEGDLLAEDVVSTLLKLGPALEPKAYELALAKKLRRWRAIAIVIFQNTRKRRGSVRAA
ncbi:DUF6551 family protein [Bosea minatitlanensis]|uniref:DUF6551 family protein n=1 Tax=Bosea minatitlanensis TaxID=128782 RepID=A0ABW0F162_9HYPH|nr:DUF6551 family protein [Bosea minatitlanensis]MCT4491778.1 hypothetical protein [Bosea minatitlanensis]